MELKKAAEKSVGHFEQDLEVSLRYLYKMSFQLKSPKSIKLLKVTRRFQFNLDFMKPSQMQPGEHIVPHHTEGESTSLTTWQLISQAPYKDTNTPASYATWRFK